MLAAVRGSAQIKEKRLSCLSSALPELDCQLVVEMRVMDVLELSAGHAFYNQVVFIDNVLSSFHSFSTK